MATQVRVPRRDWRAVARGLAAVARLLLSALDALTTAAVGVPPIAWLIGQITAAIREAYRVGRYGPLSASREVAPLVYEGELVDEERS